jgi:hypothetical protein
LPSLGEEYEHACVWWGTGRFRISGIARSSCDVR